MRKIYFTKPDLWLLDWESGEIIFDGKNLGPKGNLVPGEGDEICCQNFDLMPYATVAENVGKFISNINLKKEETVSGTSGSCRFRRICMYFPKYLSGGQQQRVAIARALSVLPKLDP
jgi:ABC-type polar amino acid transport system ATPase subunit